LKEFRESNSGNHPPTGGGELVEGSRARASGSGFRQRPKDVGVVWYLDTNGKLSREMVRTGISDGTNTEIVKSDNLTDGMKVISGVAVSGTVVSAPQSSHRGFGRPPF
jgi:hypothetical protein